MKELLEIAFWGPNVVPAVLAAFALFYWLMVIIGFFDFDTVDVDIDVDVDADIDIDMDADVDADADTDASNHGPGGWKGFLTFLNLGKVPLMALLSFYALFWWSGSILTTYYLMPAAWLGWLLLIPILFVSMILSKYITAPIGKIFQKLDQTAAPFDAIGKICEIIIEVSPGKYGQARVNHHDGWVNVMVKTEKDLTLNKGDKAVIIEFNKLEKYYLIEPFNI